MERSLDKVGKALKALDTIGNYSKITVVSIIYKFSHKREWNT